MKFQKKNRTPNISCYAPFEALLLAKNHTFRVYAGSRTCALWEGALYMYCASLNNSSISRERGGRDECVDLALTVTQPIKLDLLHLRHCVCCALGLDVITSRDPNVSSSSRSFMARLFVTSTRAIQILEKLVTLRVNVNLSSQYYTEYGWWLSQTVWKFYNASRENSNEWMKSSSMI